MANWCSFNVVIYGDREEATAFYRKAKNAMANGKEKGEYDTYCLYEEHNFKKDFILSMHSNYIGGTIEQMDEPKFDGKDWYLSIYLETRWAPMIDGFDLMLEQYKTLKAVYLAEECGAEIYFNTDEEHRFFKVKYCIYEDDIGSEYFDTDEEFINFMKDTFNIEISSIDDLADDDEIEYKGDNTINFHRFINV